MSPILGSLGGSNPFANSDGSAPLSNFSPTLQPIGVGGASGANASGASGANASGAAPTQSVGSDLSEAGGVVSGVMSGTPTGYASAALNAGKLAAGNNAFGASSGSVSSGLGYGANALGLYQGLKTGGAAGDTEAAVNAAEIGARAGAFGSTADSMIGEYVPIVGDALSLYNTAENWQSGNTGSDALNGAETGATIGSAFGPIGAAVGAIGGALVGAASSAFGGGEKDAETQNWDQIAGQLAANPSLASELNPAQAYQSLAGVMDAKNDTAGHSQPMEQVFGRGGEQNMMDQMTTQINSAIASGKVSPTADAQTLYSKVVAPWLASKHASIANQNTSNGQPEGPALQADITALIGQWQSGALTPQSQVGIGGQTIGGLPNFAGDYTGPKVAAFGVPQTVPYSPAQLMLQRRLNAGSGSADRIGALGYEQM